MESKKTHSLTVVPILDSNQGFFEGRYTDRQYFFCREFSTIEKLYPKKVYFVSLNPRTEDIDQYVFTFNQYLQPRGLKLCDYAPFYLMGAMKLIPLHHMPDFMCKDIPIVAVESKITATIWNLYNERCYLSVHQKSNHGSMERRLDRCVIPKNTEQWFNQEIVILAQELN